MSARSALSRLAEQVAVMSSEFRRIKKHCTDLERKVERLSRPVDNTNDPGSRSSRKTQAGAGATSAPDRDRVKAKLEEMLAELADFG